MRKIIGVEHVKWNKDGKENEAYRFYFEEPPVEGAYGVRTSSEFIYANVAKSFVSGFKHFGECVGSSVHVLYRVGYGGKAVPDGLMLA